MKKIRSIFLILIGFFVILVISACGNNNEVKLPSSKIEKVKFAFEGVESSLKNSNSSKKLKSNYASSASKTYDVPKLKLMANTINSDNISTIYNAMSIEKETSNPSFKYDEPPMIQFQYLKALYDEVGENFSFAKKYTYNLTGNVYYDFKNRTVAESDDYLQQYSFDISIKIDIDDNDLITAIVGFDITYTKSGISRNQKRYSELILDYDMNETSPTYELTMIDIDDLLSYESDDEKYISAEYDYVNVDANIIKEWRKFGVCSPDTLVNYQDNDYIYKYSVLRAYKDNKLYHLENSFNDNKNLKSAVLNGLGFNNVILSRDSFKNEVGTQNDKIKIIVDKFNKILGKDIVYSFVYTGATEKWVKEENPESDNLFLRIESTGGYQIYEDVNILDLFDPNKGWNEKGVKTHLDILYKNGEDNTLDTYNDFNNLNVKVRSKSYDNTEWINIDDNVKTFSQYIKESGLKGSYLEEGFLELEFDMSLKSNSNVKLQAPLILELYNNDVYNDLLKDYDIANNYINSYVPLKDKIPTFDGNENCYYTPNVDGTNLTGSITINCNNNLNTLMNNYINKLNTLKFAHKDNTDYYSKRIADDYVLILTIFNVTEKDPNTASIRFEFKKQQVSTSTITDALNALIDNDNIKIPTFEGNYEFSVDGNNLKIEYYNYDLISDYLSSLSSYGFEVGTMDGYTASFIYVDGIIYVLKQPGYSIEVDKFNVKLSIVGDINNWNEKDTTCDLDTLEAESQVIISKVITIGENQAIKIVKDHSWDGGGFGFNLFAGSTTFDPIYYQSGENDNIIFLEEGTYKIEIAISLGGNSINPKENMISPLFINIYKQ